MKYSREQLQDMAQKAMAAFEQKDPRFFELVGRLSQVTNTPPVVCIALINGMSMGEFPEDMP